MMEQVCNALLKGDTNITSTYISFTFYRAYFACSIPRSVISASMNFLSNLADKYISLSR